MRSAAPTLKHLVLLTSILFLAGNLCSAAEPTPAKARPLRVLHIQIPQDIMTLDWTKSASEVDRPILANLHEGLVALDREGRPVPQLAESWSVSADGKTYKLVLRDGLKWSDGAQLTATHVLDGMHRLLSPFTSSSYAHLLFDVKGAQEFNERKIKDFDAVGIQALDAKTIEIELNKPIPNWITTLAIPATYPVREDLIKQFGPLWMRPGNLVVAGPFTLQQHEFGRSITLTRNPYYHGPRGNIDQMAFSVLNEAQTNEQFTAGKLDLVFDVTPAQLKRFAKKPALRFFPALRTKRLSFNLKKFPISDPGVREMLARCMDRDAITKKLGVGYQAGRSLAPPPVIGYDPNGGHKPDFARARLYYRDHFSMMGALKLSVVVPAFDENAAENQIAAEALGFSIQSCLKLPLEIEYARDATKWALLTRGGAFSMIMHDWKPDVPDPYDYYSLYSSESRLTAQWSNAEYESALKLARSATQPKDRKSLYRKVDQLLTNRQTAMVPLYYHADALLVGPRIKDFQYDAFNLYSLASINLK